MTEQRQYPHIIIPHALERLLELVEPLLLLQLRQDFLQLTRQYGVRKME